MSVLDLKPLRAPGHRAFIGMEFGGPSAEADPEALSPGDVLADPRLMSLGRAVFEELRLQFAEPAGAAHLSDEEEAYRQKLETWADILEILLEETLNELETLNAARAGLAHGPG
ncbi:hypothetical protein EV663_101687 [Rhodovulum bhavnagarense]|uniref:Uncharacterized protein n=1 Tax=Rhodovulum bhavnagarense TaxID=992286 RepID=A0A4R2RKR8_9RHOB|nr:hypothetical protein [Rhodovulum bhavnagarense]TCP63418.1 hypothetical protein EV663_101687 [Rhodovulum bhavnagarense]